MSLGRELLRHLSSDAGLVERVIIIGGNLAALVLLAVYLLNGHL